MGCCFNKEEDKYQTGEASETSPLLNPASAGVGNSRAIQSNHATPPQPPRKNNVHDAMNKILVRAAHNVIDVSTIDGRQLHTEDYSERVRQYRQKVAALRPRCAQGLVKAAQLPPGVPAPGAVLTRCTVSAEDIDLIMNASQELSDIVKNIQVTKLDKELVVAYHVL